MKVKIYTRKKEDSMIENLLVKQIINVDKPEEKINSIEIKLYSDLIKKKNEKDNRDELAKDIFYQLVDERIK